MSSPNPESSGPPLRALAMVLISLAILFAAIGALSLTGSDDTEEAASEATTSAVEQAPATSSPAQAPASAGSSTTRSSATPTTGAVGDVEVRVLNNSSVSGLAAETAETLTSEGWNVAETGNFSETQIAETTVYYDTSSGAQSAAQQISQQLGVAAEPRPSTMSSFGDGVIVVVTQS